MKEKPQVGDIVYWTGYNGPQHVLIQEAYDMEGIYYVLYLEAEEYPEDNEWSLNDNNAQFWEVVG